MVSTRGVKLKFFEGERVLCYEPDPTKAKVLYDSKVLEVIAHRDDRGRKVVEYLIHFQGWNPSWDRCVSEEFVLKDTAENRQLQKDLAEKSQLHLGAYLYRKERKKRKLSDKVNASSEDGSCGSPALMDEEDTVRNTSSSEEESSGDDEGVQLELPQELKIRLEHDYHLIHNKHKLMKLPASPNVVNILESYWKYYVSNQLSCLSEKQTKYKPFTNCPKSTPEEVQRNINLCREVLDGLRIYFDFTLQDLLLYRHEKGQIQTSQAKFLPMKLTMKDENHSKTEHEDHELGQSPRADEEAFHNDNAHSSRFRTRRILRSTNRLAENANGNNENSASRDIITQSNITLNNDSYSTSKLPVFKVLPEHVYSQYPPPPCLVFGVVHLTRLFVKLPDLLNTTSMTEEKLKILMGRLEQFLDFLIDHKEWYEETTYVDARKQEVD